jgi:hypothetical protein
MLPKCAICLEKVFIPVELICFQCSKTNEINCHSFNRVCEKCVIDYLSLDKHAQDRDSIKKCIYCDSVINPQKIVESPYKIDFLLMSLDNDHEVMCPFCNQYCSTHINVYKHLQKDCYEYKIHCICGFYDSRKYIDSSHKKKCCFFKECIECHNWIYIKDYDKHIQSEHNKNYCNICSRTTLLERIEHIESECIYRLIQCKYCDKKLMAETFLDHLIVHLDDCKLRLELLKDVHEKETKLYHNLVEQIKVLYQNIYNSSLNDDIIS